MSNVAMQRGEDRARRGFVPKSRRACNADALRQRERAIARIAEEYAAWLAACTAGRRCAMNGRRRRSAAACFGLVQVALLLLASGAAARKPREPRLQHVQRSVAKCAPIGERRGHASDGVDAGTQEEHASAPLASNNALCARESVQLKCSLRRCHADWSASAEFALHGVDPREHKSLHLTDALELAPYLQRASSR
eukprot:scaffold4418_cov199-Prasinococcus_capsulatus_cf.AAC.1